MTDYNEGELRLVKVVQSHAMSMSHLSSELQDAIEKMPAGWVKNGTPVGTVSPQAPRNGIWFEQNGELVSLSAFEVCFVMGRMYEQDKAGGGPLLPKMPLPPHLRSEAA
jgi:hypothetical protein